MTDSRDISEWTRRIEHWPVPKEMRDGAIKYATSIFERQFPVIFEFNHLSEELEIGRRTLADIVNRTEGFYREFTIPKRRGGYRKIAVPSPSLLLAQRWILRNILEQIALHPRCYGFVKKRSIIDNAREHIGCENLLKVDIRDFFHPLEYRGLWRCSCGLVTLRMSLIIWRVFVP